MRPIGWKDEVIDGIRAQSVTRDVPLIAKRSVREGDDAVYPWRSPGNTIEDAIQVAKWCVDAGANAIHVTAGTIFPHPWNPAGYLPAETPEPCSLCNRCLLAAPEFPVGCLDERRCEARFSRSN
jgi:hypothetical protein